MTLELIGWLFFIALFGAMGWLIHFVLKDDQEREQ